MPILNALGVLWPALAGGIAAEVPTGAADLRPLLPGARAPAFRATDA